LSLEKHVNYRGEPSCDLETDLETIFIVQRDGQGRGWSGVGGGGKLSISATHPDLITVPQSRLQSVPKIVRPIFYVIVTSTSYSASIDCKILSAVLSIHAHHTKIFYYFIRARCSFNCVIVYLLSRKKIWSLKQIQTFRIFQIRSTWRPVTDNGW